MLVVLQYKKNSQNGSDYKIDVGKDTWVTCWLTDSK